MFRDPIDYVNPVEMEGDGGQLPPAPPPSPSPTPSPTPTPGPKPRTKSQ